MRRGHEPGGMIEALDIIYSISVNPRKSPSCRLLPTCRGERRNPNETTQAAHDARPVRAWALSARGARTIETSPPACPDAPHYAKPRARRAVRTAPTPLAYGKVETASGNLGAELALADLAGRLLDDG